jgi:hypothetical protein
MTAPPALGRDTEAVSRGSRQKQPRAFDKARRVPVVGENSVLIDVCTPDRLENYLAAPNAEVNRRADGSIKWIRLRSVGDDRSHSGERHGRSNVTTERVRNDWGDLVGGEFNLRHKATGTGWRASTVPVQSQTAHRQLALLRDSKCPDQKG